ncbi:MAG: class I SAM-dependent methyltransferase [Hyphomicrobiales bacterium]
MSDPYAADARWYDLIHAGFDDDIGLWLSFAGRTDRPVLEVGCGTGRIAVPLAAAGHRVTGIDPSEAMLERARARAAAEGVTVEWIRCDPAAGQLPADHFGFVLLANDVFLYAADGDEQVDLLRALAATLTFDGLLAIDVPGPANHLDPSLNGQPLLVYDGGDGEGGSLTAWHVREDDLAAQTRDLTILYDVTSPGGVLRRYRSEHHLRYPYRFELEYLLRAAGLAQLDVYGDYELGPLTNGSDRLIVTARRVQG